MRKLSVRPNPDEDIRKLERIAQQTKASADIAAYWKACLRRKELPAPNFTKADGIVASFARWFIKERGAWIDKIILKGDTVGDPPEFEQSYYIYDNSKSIRKHISPDKVLNYLKEILRIYEKTT